MILVILLSLLTGSILAYMNWKMFKAVNAKEEWLPIRIKPSNFVKNERERL